MAQSVRLLVCDGGCGGSQESESRAKAASSEASRLARVEKSAASLDEKCRSLQAALDKKSEMLERMLKRRGGGSLGGAPPPLPPSSAPRASLSGGGGSTPCAALPPPPMPALLPPPTPPPTDHVSSAAGEPMRAYALPSSRPETATSEPAVVAYVDPGLEGHAHAAAASHAPMPTAHGTTPAAKENAGVTTATLGKLSAKGGLGGGGGGLSARGPNHSVPHHLRPPSPRWGDGAGSARSAAGSDAPNSARSASAGRRKSREVASRFREPSPKPAAPFVRGGA